MATAATDHDREPTLFAGAVVRITVGAGPRGERIARKRLTRSPLWSGRRWAQHKARFIERAKLQQAMAEASPCWMPISDVGERGDDAVAYTTPVATLTGDAIVDGRCALEGAGLRRISLAIVRGLDALREKHDRAHGNLRPGNVLLTGTGPVARRDVKLADPADAASLGDKTAKDDLRAIGRLLHQLATGLASDGSAVADGDAWRGLGIERDAWRVLCARLLSGRVETLAELESSVRRIGRRATRRRVVRRALAASLAVAVAGGGYGAYTWANYVKYDADKWHELVDNAGWFRELDDLYKRRPELFAQDDASIQAIRALLDERVEADPFRIAGGARGRSLLDLRNNPDTSITGSLGAKKTKRAVELIQSVRQKLSDPKLRVTVTLNAVIELCNDPARPWKLPATYARTLLSNMQPDPTNPRFATVIEQALTLEPRFDELIAQAKALNAGRARLSTISKGPAQWIQTAVEQAEREELQQSSIDDVTAADVGRFVDGVAGWAKVLTSLNDALDGTVDQLAWDIYQQEKPYADAKGREQFHRIAETVRDFVRLSESDLRPVVNVVDDAMLANFDASLANLSRKQELKAEADALRQQRDAVVKSLAAVRTMAPIRKYLKPLNEQALAIRGSVELINGGIGTLQLAFRKDADRWLDQQRATTSLTSDAALDEVWTKRRDAVVARYGPDAIRRDVGIFNSAGDEIATLRGSLLELATVVPQAAPLPPGALEEEWSKRVATAAWAEQRPQVVSTLLSNLAWAADVPALKEPASVAALQSARGDVARWSTSAAGVIAEMRAAERAMDGMLTQADESPAGGQPPLVDLRRRWGAHPLLSSADARVAAAPVTGRIDAMLALESADRAGLLGRIESASPGQDELRLAAWQRLSKVEAVPNAATIGDELAATLRARDAVLQRIGRVGDGPRRTALAGRVAEGTKAAWKSYAAKAADRATLDVTLGEVERFGIADADLSPRDAYNAEVRRLAHVDLTRGEDELVKPLQAFVDRAAKMQPALGSSAPQLAAFTDGLGKLVRKDQQDDPAQKAGPALSKLGWKGRSFDGGKRVIYSPSDALLANLPKTANPTVIEFVLVVPESGRPFYISTNEVPVGLLLAVAPSNPGEAARLLSGGSAEDLASLPGPRNWTIKQGKPAVNTAGWLPSDPNVPREAQYFPSAKLSGPSLTSPLQQVSPAVAAWVTSTLNCRLPTVGEWRAALALSRDATPNLRDGTWRQQADHVEQQAKVGTILPAPDDGAFPIEAPKGSVWQVAANGQRAAAGGAPYDDGTLWFRPAAAAGDGVLHDMIGNVAEFVTDDGAAARVLVIGGSALSPPTWDERVPLPLPKSRDVFADVGFRLAFTSPRTPISIGLPRLLATYGYLPPTGAAMIPAAPAAAP